MLYHSIDLGWVGTGKEGAIMLICIPHLRCRVVFCQGVIMSGCNASWLYVRQYEPPFLVVEMLEIRREIPDYIIAATRAKVYISI